MLAQLAVPMCRMPGTPYCQRRLDLTLTGPEAQALRDIFDGLTISGKFAHKSAGPQDALRWLLHRAAEAMHPGP